MHLNGEKLFSYITPPPTLFKLLGFFLMLELFAARKVRYHIDGSNFDREAGVKRE